MKQYDFSKSSNEGDEGVCGVYYRRDGAVFDRAGDCDVLALDDPFRSRVARAIMGIHAKALEDRRTGAERIRDEDRCASAHRAIIVETRDPNAGGGGCFFESFVGEAYSSRIAIRTDGWSGDARLGRA